MADKIRRVTMRVDPYERLGELVEAARLAKTDPETGRPHSVKSAALAVPMSRSTWSKIETKHEEADKRSYAQVEAFLGWEAGSIWRYLHKNGTEPGPAPVIEETVAPGGVFIRVEGPISDEDRALLEAMAQRMARGERP